MCKSNSIVDMISEINSEIVKSHNIPEKLLCVIENNDGSESVWLREPVTNKKSKMAFNCSVKGRKTAPYFSLTVKNKIISILDAPQDVEVKTINSDKENTYINFKSWNDEIRDFAKSIIVHYIETFEPADKFGCCGKYAECSKEGKCLHENKFHAKACWYRKNLESGKIFF